jgi:hypothetical protein
MLQLSLIAKIGVREKPFEITVSLQNMAVEREDLPNDLDKT